MRVAVLPTGRTEWHGLAPALGRLFPDHHFYCLPTENEVVSDPDHFPYNGITSLRLGEAHIACPPEAAANLLERAIQEALGDRHREAADLVIIVDDLELANMNQPGLVLDVVRSAANTHLAGLDGKLQTNTRRVLQEKVSFHLVVPMIEAWLFGDPQALARAGLPPSTQPQLPSGIDLEAFQTMDPAYLAATPTDCSMLAGLPPKKQKKLRPKWFGAQRDLHPKGYLQWLTLDASDKTCTRYSETEGGGPALAALDWSTVFANRPQAHLRYLRALIEDLEDGLGTAAQGGPYTPQAAPATSRHALPPHPILRNL